MHYSERLRIDAKILHEELEQVRRERDRLRQAVELALPWIEGIQSREAFDVEMQLKMALVS